MAFPVELKKDVENYMNKHHPNQAWWEQYFDIVFINDVELTVRLVQEMMSIRSIYQLLEGLRATNELQRAQCKIQIITYASVYEAVLHHIIFQGPLKDTDEVANLLSYTKFVKRDIPQIEQGYVHFNEKIYTMAALPAKKQERYIKFEDILSTAKELELINDKLYTDLLELYKLRNAIHICAEISRGIQYELNISKKAHSLLKPFKRQIIDGLKKRKIVNRTYNVRFSRKEIAEI